MVAVAITASAKLADLTRYCCAPSWAALVISSGASDDVKINTGNSLQRFSKLNQDSTPNPSSTGTSSKIQICSCCSIPVSSNVPT